MEIIRSALHLATFSYLDCSSCSMLLLAMWEKMVHCRLHLRGLTTFCPRILLPVHRGALLMGTSDMAVFVAVLAGNGSDLEDTSFQLLQSWAGFSGHLSA